MKEQTTVISTTVNGETRLLMPITKLECVEDTATVVDAAVDGDFIPIMDSNNRGQMKKISVRSLLGNIIKTANDAADAAKTAIDKATEAQEAVSNAQGASITVDDALSSTSTNPVQNKVVNEAIEAKFPKTGGTISGDISVTGNISATGNITGAKVYNAVWNADYAEGFDYEGDIPKPGEIVELCGNNKVRVASAGSDMVVGVCSATYWALAGASVEDIERGVKVAVGIAGQLPIKVRGAVKYGDYIVCGGDGIGEARSKPDAGQVVGRAMESNASSEIKDVNCIIQIR